MQLGRVDDSFAFRTSEGEQTMMSPEKFFEAAHVQLVAVGDAKVAVRRFGCGEALLLIHGWPLDGFTWRHLLQKLSEKHCCYVIDLPGLGESVWTKATDFSFLAHAKRLKLLMAKLEIKRYAVIAHDTGATIARCLSLIDLDAVESLCLINTEIPHHRPPFIRLYQYAMLIPGSQLLFRGLLRLRYFRHSRLAFGPCFYEMEKADGSFDKRYGLRFSSSARLTEGLVRYLQGIDWKTVDSMEEAHANIMVPVLLIWGEADPTFPIFLARKMVDQFPMASPLVPIACARLLPHEERPEEVFCAFQRFLENTRAHSSLGILDAVNVT